MWSSLGQTYLILVQRREVTDTNTLSQFNYIISIALNNHASSFSPC
jgi:hypothetical protein